MWSSIWLARQCSWKARQILKPKGRLVQYLSKYFVPGSVVFTILLLVFGGIVLYRRQWSRQKGLSQLSGSTHYEDMTRLHNNGNNSIWVNGNVPPGWQQKDQFQAVQDQLYAEVGDNKSHLMSTFGSNNHYRMTNEPAPYATTTLAMQNRIRNLVIFTIF